MRRATHKWGAKDAFNRLKWLLLDGKLSAYASNRAAKLTRYPPNTWTFSSNDYLLSDPDERYPGMQTLYAATLFLTSELDGVLPAAEEQAEREKGTSAARPQRLRQKTRGEGLKSTTGIRYGLKCAPTLIGKGHRMSTRCSSGIFKTCLGERRRLKVLYTRRRSC